MTFGEIKVLKKVRNKAAARADEARALLERAADQVLPIMAVASRKWSVPILTEFFPKVGLPLQ